MTSEHQKSTGPKQFSTGPDLLLNNGMEEIKNFEHKINLSPPPPPGSSNCVT